MLARAQHTEHVGAARDRRHGHDAAAERLAERVQVGGDVLVIEREHGAGAGQARLDLVGDQQCARVVADPAHPGQVAVRRHDHAGLALDRFHQHGGGALGHGGGQRLGVAVGHHDEPGRERPEVGPRRVVGGERYDRGGPPVEVRRGDHDLGPVLGHALDPVGPLAGHLHRRLDGLGAGVHRQHHLGARQLGQFPAERAELVVVERARRQRHPVELLPRGPHQLGVPVAEVQRRVPGQEVQVVPAVHIGDPRALSLGEHDGQRVVGVGAPALVEVDQVGGAAVEVGQRCHAFQTRATSAASSAGEHCCSPLFVVCSAARAC